MAFITVEEALQKYLDAKDIKVKADKEYRNATAVLVEALEQAGVLMQDVFHVLRLKLFSVTRKK